MRNPLRKVRLTPAQFEAAMKYVRDNFGEVPRPFDQDHDDLEDSLYMLVDENDVTAWLGHILTTAPGLWALARIKLGLGAPESGLQWLGMATFVNSCKILIKRGYPPADAKLEGEIHQVPIVEQATEFLDSLAIYMMALLPIPPYITNADTRRDCNSPPGTPIEG